MSDQMQQLIWAPGGQGTGGGESEADARRGITLGGPMTGDCKHGGHAATLQGLA